MAEYVRQVLRLWQADDDTAIDQLQQIGIAGALGVFMLFLVLFMNLLAFNMLNKTWLDGNWRSYWLFAGGPMRFYWFLPLASIASSRAATRASQPPRSPRVRKLRQAALDGDDIRAPIPRDQPEPFAEGELHAAVEIIPRLRPLAHTRSSLTLSGGIGVLIFAALLMCGVVVLMSAGWLDLAPASGYSDPYDGLLVADFAATLIAIAALVISGIVLIRRIPRRFRRIDPVVDPWGVRWITPTRPLEEKHILWEDVRAFYQISYRSQADYSRHTTYFLDTGDTLLAWEISSSGWDELLAYNERFLRIITTYTNLPLRDLSDAVEKLGKSFADATKMTHSERRASLRAAREARRARQNRQNRQRRQPNAALIAGGAALLALLFLPTLAGLRMQSMQRGYYYALAAQALAHRPLFTDALSQPDGLWPVKAPDGGHDASYSYQSGAYQISGGPVANTVDATLPTVYGDAAIQVSARQSGTSAYNGVGLIVRDVESGPTQSFVAFWIMPDGGWLLERFHSDVSNPTGQWTELASSRDSSSRGSPMNRGLGASNTILILMRGNEIICYVNGQWVGGARDDAIPAAGRVGVYLDDGANTGIFSDFVVYPAA